MVIVIRVLFYNCVYISPSASLTSMPWMFNSFGSDNLLEKNPLTKSFDLLRSYLVLSVMVLIDIILLYKTTSASKMPLSSRSERLWRPRANVVGSKPVRACSMDGLGSLFISCFNKPRIVFMNIWNHLRKYFVIFFIHLTTLLWDVIKQRRIFVI